MRDIFLEIGRRDRLGPRLLDLFGNLGGRVIKQTPLDSERFRLVGLLLGHIVIAPMELLARLVQQPPAALFCVDRRRKRVRRRAARALRDLVRLRGRAGGAEGLGSGPAGAAAGAGATEADAALATANLAFPSSFIYASSVACSSG